MTIQPELANRFHSKQSGPKEDEQVRVRCIDPELESINGRTGVVIQTIPHADYVESDIDFGRGLGIVRLTEPQYEIIPLGA